MPDILSQKQIDDLVNNIKNGGVPVSTKGSLYICRYCKDIIRFKMEDDAYAAKLFLNGCGMNGTGHLYYSKEYLKNKSRNLSL